MVSLMSMPSTERTLRCANTRSGRKPDAASAVPL
jgi:hypothetical protein